MLRDGFQAALAGRLRPSSLLVHLGGGPPVRDVAGTFTVFYWPFQRRQRR